MSKVSVAAEEYAVKFNMAPNCVGPKGVSVDIVYYKTPPKNWNKKKVQEALAGDLRPTSKPDNDNVEKCVFDSLNKIFFADDAAIVENSTKKFYALEPSIEITVKYL
jgi:Holliday junction resolvase RusA-like endonuclease